MELNEYSRKTITSRLFKEAEGDSVLVFATTLIPYNLDDMKDHIFELSDFLDNFKDSDKDIFSEDDLDPSLYKAVMEKLGIKSNTYYTLACHSLSTDDIDLSKKLADDSVVDLKQDYINYLNDQLVGGIESYTYVLKIAGSYIFKVAKSEFEKNNFSNLEKVYYKKVSIKV